MNSWYFKKTRKNRITKNLYASRKTSNHFRYILSMIKPEKTAIKRPGKVEIAITFPSANSEPVSWITNQLTATRLNPKPTKDTIFPRKNSKKVGFFSIENNIVVEKCTSGQITKFERWNKYSHLRLVMIQPSDRDTTWLNVVADLQLKNAIVHSPRRSAYYLK